MATAFQANAFQIDAFQITIDVGVTISATEPAIPDEGEFIIYVYGSTPSASGTAHAVVSIQEISQVGIDPVSIQES